MITTKTVLVLGAGASKPWFPTGKELVRRICGFVASMDSVNWFRAFWQWLEIYAAEEMASWGNVGDNMKSLYQALLESRPYSIDEFFEQRRDVADAGRLAISICLLQAERDRQSEMWSDATEDHWYDYLKSKLVNPPEMLGQDQLRIITFNYERSLEHFLYRSLKPYYSITMKDEEYAAAMKRFQFLHIFGRLGPLPWQSTTGAVPYGTQDYGETLAAAKNIKVLHQGIEDEVQQNFRTAQEWLKWADRILFLGFGFHPDSVKRLALDDTLHTKVKATCKGLDQTNKYTVESCLWGSHFLPSTSLIFPNSDADCYTFLHNHVVLS